MSITDAISLAATAFLLGFAYAAWTNRRQRRHDRLGPVISDLEQLRDDLTTAHSGSDR